MLSSPDFESESSFLGSQSSDRSFGDAEVESMQGGNDGWGIVSVTNDGSEVSVMAGERSDTEFMNSGVLILDGIESSLGDPTIEASTRNEILDLSIPGTDSLPTDVGSLDGRDQLMDVASEGDRGRTHFMGASSMLWLLVPVICSSIAGMGYLLHERNTWRSSALRLELEIQRLELESERIRNSCENAPWEETPPSKLITILDNCWVQAKADIAFGACSEEAKEYIRDLSHSVRGKWGAIWNAASDLGTATILESVQVMGHALANAATSFEADETCDYLKNQSNPRGLNSFSEAVSGFPATFGDAVAAASDIFAANVAALIGEKSETKSSYNVSDDPVIDFSALSDTMTAISEGLAVEIEEFSSDPWNYLTVAARNAMKGASVAAKPEFLTTNGLFATESKVVKSSSLDVKGASANSKPVTVKITEIMDDPFSYFEYQSTTASG